MANNGHVNICFGLLVVMFFVNSVIAPPPRVVEMKEEEKLVDQIAPASKEKVDVKQPAEILPVDKLQPPDHLDAVKLEQDGMINKDYKKEIFLGNHEEIEDDTYEVAESKLKDIFVK